MRELRVMVFWKPHLLDDTKMKELKLTHLDLAKCKKPLTNATNSIDDMEVQNVFQYLTPEERVSFVNEIHRVLKKGSKCQVVIPHWCSNLYYGDLAIVWPPVSEQWFNHLSKEWREANKPQMKGYKCDFDKTGGYGLHPGIVSRNQEYQQNAITFWKEAATALAVSLIKR